MNSEEFKATFASRFNKPCGGGLVFRFTCLHNKFFVVGVTDAEGEWWGYCNVPLDGRIYECAMKAADKAQPIRLEDRTFGCPTPSGAAQPRSKSYG